VKVRVSTTAEREATEAACWYEDRQRGLGAEFLETYSHVLQEIEGQPDRFGRLETISSSREFRRCLLRRFPYSIVYEILPDEVIVLAVAHVSRRPNYWVGRKH